MNNKTIHFLLRYSDSLKNVNTFEEHKKIEKLKGYVWLGKFGIGASKEKVNLAKHQIKKNTNTYLYLALDVQIKYKAKVLDILGGGTRRNIKSPEPSHVPIYYRKNLCSIWFKVNNLKIVPRKEIDSLHLYNDPYSKPLMLGMRSLVYVIRGGT